MSSTFNETDFDLSFFSQPAFDSGVHTYTQKHVNIQRLKRKIISINILVTQNKEKQLLLEQMQKTLLASKEESKQICLEYNLATEKCSDLEKSVQFLQSTNEDLNSKFAESENYYGALQSHTNQLQLHVQEMVTKVEALKTENELEKSNAKDIKKKLTTLQRKNELLIKHLSIAREFIFGKKKSSKKFKALMKMYNKPPDDTWQKYIFEDQNNAYEFDAYHSQASSPDREDFPGDDDANEIYASIPNSSDVALTDAARKLSEVGMGTNRDDMDYDSNMSNGLVSEDTGRGSSLAFSDIEKCFQSPDYFSNDSPLNGLACINNQKPKHVERGTSPIVIHETNPASDLESLKHLNTKDASTSPVLDMRLNNIPTVVIERGTSPINVHNTHDRTLMENNNERKNNYKDCLELNSSNNLCHGNVDDTEVLMILNEMRMKSKLITPMPMTPSKAQHSSCHENTINPVEVDRIENGFEISENISDDLERQLGNRTPPLNVSIERVQNVLNRSENYLSTIKPSKRLQFEHPLPILTEDTHCSLVNRKQTAASVSQDYTENVNESLSVSNDNSAEILSQMRMLKSRRLAKLEIVRQKVLQKKRISRKIFLDEKLRLTPKKLVLIKKKLSRIESSESIDDIAISEISPKIVPESLSQQVRNTYDDTNVKERFNRSIRSNSLNSNGKAKKNRALPHIKTRNKVRHSTVLKKKVTRLDRLKKQVLPKGKIRRPATPIKSSSHFKPKQLKLHKKKVEASDSSATLNDKEVYEKALKVMAELKSKQKCVGSEKIIFKKPSAIINKKKKILNQNRSSGNDKNSINGANYPIADVNNKRAARPAPHSPNEKISNYILPQIEGPVKNTRVSPKTTGGKIQYPSGTNQTSVTMSVSPEIKRLPERKCRRYSKENNSSKSPINIIHDYSNPMVVVTDVLKGNHDMKDNITKRISKDITKTSEYNVPVIINRITISPKSNNKRRESDSIVDEIPSKRLLRSSTIQQARPDVTQDDKYCKKNMNCKNSSENKRSEDAKRLSHRVIQYDDLDLFATDQKEHVLHKNTRTPVQQASNDFSPQKDNILCSVLNKYGRHIIKAKAKTNESAGNAVCETIEKAILEIKEMSPNHTRDAMNKLVESLKILDSKHFLLGLMKYLENPERKTELFSKVFAPPAPPLTKSEQILLYVIAKLKVCWADIDIVNLILNSIEYTLFRLNHTPLFETIESMSHFYAVLCRYFRIKSRLRLFLLDAMYCLQFKALPLIRQCLDVWMHILPLSHMGIAKSPIVTCLVYLLHFYKCDDRMNRVQDIRHILNTKYSYKMSEWNETKILETLKYAIQDLRAIPVEIKMLRLSIIILAKRQGPRWCQKNIISKILQPMIENPKTSVRVRLFCISLLGSLLKPFPADMKVNCEVTMNRLLDMLKLESSDQTKEAIFTSLIYMSKHNHYKVYKALLSYNLRQMSPELEKLLKDFVREKPIKAWKAILSRLRFEDDDNC